VARFTSNRAAQYLAGLVFAFAPYRVAHVVHLELLWTAFLPLALLALYRLLEQPSVRRGIAFGVVVGLQGLCSVYYVVFLVLWLVPAVLLAPLHIAWRPSRRLAGAFAVAVLASAVLLVPYMGPYSRARQALGPRPEHDLQQFSAVVDDYARVSRENRLYAPAPREEEDERSLFVGAVALALSGVAVVWTPTRVVWVFVALTAMAVDLSLGVNGVLFPWLRAVLPIVNGFRAPARFAVFALLGVSVLAGIGAARLLSAFRPAVRHGIAATVALAMLAEYWAAPLTTYQAPLTPARVDAWLTREPPTIVAAFPLPLPGSLWGYETVFQYHSIFHWQPMVNGYSGYAPPSYLRLVERVQDFPSTRAVEQLREYGVEVVVLYERYSQPGEFDRLLDACHDSTWFSEVRVMQDIGRGRSAACRLAATR
jgi:hypothetical protein